MAAKPKATTTEKVEMTVVELNEGVARYRILGTTPLIFNRMSEKAKRMLLMPAPRMNEAEKAANLKHDPEAEYRASVYKFPPTDMSVATRLKMPSEAFKKAVSSAALDMPGATKAAVGRLVSVDVGNFHVWGVPKLFMSVVRMADMARTPDIRTRAILEHWAAEIEFRFIQPKLNLKTMNTLVHAAGILVGVGDWRQEKGSGSYGKFRAVDEKDPFFTKIQREGGTKAQDAALEDFECYDDESAELLAWYNTEIRRRGRDLDVKIPRELIKPEMIYEEDPAIVAAAAKRGRGRPRGNGAYA